MFRRIQEKPMRISRCVPAAAALCIGAALPHGASATDLTGLWTTGLDACDKVFVTKGSRTSFRQDSDMYGTGFIIDGKRIRSPHARCTVTKTKEDNDVVHMIASCATDIMYANTQFSLKTLGEGKVSRVFPGIEGMEMVFYRCPARPK
jgi:hypothetical protein